MVLLAPGSTPAETSREPLVHGPASQPRCNVMTWPLFAQPAGGPAPTTAAIRPSVLLCGRSVVLTIGRLVASNPTCFASVHAPAISAQRAATSAWRLDDSTDPSLSRMPQESKGFLGICSIPCSHGHTASLPGDIPIEADCADDPLATQHRGNRIGLVVPHLEHNPAIWDHLRIRAIRRWKMRKPSSPPSSARRGSKQRTSGSSAGNLS